MKYSIAAFFLAFVGFLGLPLFAANDLAGTEWTLLAYNGSGTQVGALSFDATMMYSKFCNNVAQGYVHNNGALYASGAGISTMMYCEGMPMTLEYAFQLTTTPSPVVMTGDQLMITVSGNVFLFAKITTPTICTAEYAPVCGVDGKAYGNACNAAAVKVAVASMGESATTIPDNCIQQFDGCNTCTRAVAGAWACTKMYCENPAKAYCMMTTDDEPMVGNDRDSHGCIGSAGYSWSQSKQQCIRVWEDTSATPLEKAYDFAYNQGMTTIDSVKHFRANDKITRQEVAKMFVALAKNAFSKVKPMESRCDVKFKDDGSFDKTLAPFVYDACHFSLMKGSSDFFYPNDSLTKGQAFVVLTRMIVWFLPESDVAQWWIPYVQRAQTLDLMTTIDTSTFNDPITRGELIQWAQTIYLNASVTK